MPDHAGELLDRFTGWAAGNDAIRAAILVGSRARSDRPADAWSDVDLLVFTSNVAALRDDGAWVATVGAVILSYLEPTMVAPEIVERRTLYESGQDVDYVLLPTEMLSLFAGEPGEEAQAARRALVAGIFARGFRVLLDKDNRLGNLDALLTHSPAPRLPDAGEFTNVINDFWYHALWTARKLRRGETLMALGCCDFAMKDKLLTVARWHGQTRDGRDTWHQSRFFEDWADPRLVADFRGCYAHYDPADIARALRATMHAMDWLARETADQLAFDYADDAVRWITAQVAVTLAGVTAP